MHTIRTIPVINGVVVGRFVRQHGKLTIVVSLASGFLAYFLASLFPAIDPQVAESISESWPQIMKDLFGDPVSGFTNIYAWLNLELFHLTLWVIFGVFAALLASDVLAKEIEAKSIDILLSTPVTRTSLVLSKTAAIVLIMLVAILPTYLGCMLGVIRLGYPLTAVLLLVATMFPMLMSLVFAAVTILVSVIVPKQTYAAVIAVALLGSLYLYEDLGTLVPTLKTFDFVNPFHYYTPYDVLLHHAFSFVDPLILFSFFVAVVALASITFSRKDIPQ